VDEAEARKRPVPGSVDIAKLKNMQKQGVFVLFLLYIVSRVPYDENDSRTTKCLGTQ
jgi:hypothetical protein